MARSMLVTGLFWSSEETDPSGSESSGTEAPEVVLADDMNAAMQGSIAASSAGLGCLSLSSSWSP